MNPVYTAKLEFSIGLTDIGAQKIDGSMLNTYRIVVAVVLMTNKGNQSLEYFFSL